MAHNPVALHIPGHKSGSDDSNLITFHCPNANNTFVQGKDDLRVVNYSKTCKCH